MAGHSLTTFERRLPDAAVLAVTTADGEGHSVALSDGCSADGRFEIGSITKTMTGAVLASLVDDGIVRLDDEIGRWLNAGHNADITLVQLATHTSGLPRLSPHHVLGAPDPYQFLTPNVAEAELRGTPPKPRGAEHDYSNFGFQVLGLALERADGIAGHARGAPIESWSHHLVGAAAAVFVNEHDHSRPAVRGAWITRRRIRPRHNTLRDAL
jgi:Beta-lactamase